jgi:N-acetylglucosamine kinase-like BadF-type ATPase
MSTPTATEPVTTLGLDVGGSKTHALLVAGGRLLAELTVASANVSSVGLAAAGAALDEIVSALPPETTVDAVVAGAAGADSEAASARLASLLRERFPDAAVDVVHDTRIILAAAGLDTGSVVIAGTGSAAWAVDPEGREARAGGWGYLLGDEGSGYVLTRDAVRRALHERDRALPAGDLTRGLLAATRTADPLDLLDRFYQQPERRYWARQAHVVIAAAEGGDAVARTIVGNAAHALADLGVLVNQQVGTKGPLVLAGGLVVNQPYLARQVSDLLAQRGLTDVRVLDRDPVWGAVAIAENLERTS